jgi:hypothetical protein
MLRESCDLLGVGMSEGGSALPAHDTSDFFNCLLRDQLFLLVNRPIEVVQNSYDA